MSKTVVIVESPGKISKLKSILGDGYTVVASVGHIIDLDKKKVSIDMTKDFSPEYIALPNKKEVIANLKKAVKNADEVLLATDEDREGEMIAWSLAYWLKLTKEKTKRIVFNSITRDEILKSIQNKKDIDSNLVDAQKTRRILDRLVGYELSPLLWQKVQANLSAGRVQSVVTRLIIDRESEIDSFFSKPLVPSYQIKAVFNKNIKATLETKLEQSKTDTINLFKKLDISEFKVKSVKNKERVQNPSPPFTTSTLQQEASRKLGMSVKRTMITAQKLYEGGFITYMRTDSVHLSKEAIDKIKQYVCQTFTEKYYKKNVFKSKGNTQEAHEAIRPTHINVNQVKTLGNDEERLYSLIWKRSIASQMTPAIFDVKDIDITSSSTDYLFTSTILVLKFNGYLIIYDKEEEDISSDKQVDLSVGDVLVLDELNGTEIYEEPLPRYNEASLINKLDPKNLNIGRPATYASIIEKIQERNYVKVDNIDGIKKEQNIVILKNKKITDETKDIYIGKETNKFVPTPIGKLVTNYLINSFPEIMNYKFTAMMEQELDDIAVGTKQMGKVLTDFYNPFHKTILHIKTQTNNILKDNEKVLGNHPTLGYPVIVTTAKYGPVVKMMRTKTIAIYAPIKTPLKPETITLEEAVQLLEYPKNLGKYNKHQVDLCKGQYGIYIKYNGQNISVENDVDLEQAIKIIDEKNKEYLWMQCDDTNRYFVKEGEYGLYLAVNRIGAKTKPIFISLDKDFKIDELTVAKAKELVTNKPKPKVFKKKFVKKSEKK